MIEVLGDGGGYVREVKEGRLKCIGVFIWIWSVK